MCYRHVVPDDYLSVDEVAAEAGYSRRQVFRWIREARLVPVKVAGDRRTMLKRADVLQLLAAHRPRRSPTFVIDTAWSVAPPVGPVRALTKDF